MREVQANLVKVAWMRHIHAVLMRFCVLLAVIFLMVRSSPAAPIKFNSLKVGSKVYKNVTVIGYNATDLYFTSDDGINNLKLRLLDPQLQKQFRYNPQLAKQLEQQQAVDDLQFQHSVASNLVAKAEQAAQDALFARKAASSSEDTFADPISDKSLLGKPAPDLKIEKWLSDKPELDGKFLLLNFWAPWSIPSKKIIPELNQLQKKFADRLVIIGITSEAEKDVQEMDGPAIEFASAIDPHAKLTTAAQVTSVPSALLLNQKGIVLYQGHPGFLDEKKIQTLLAKASAEE